MSMIDSEKLKELLRKDEQEMLDKATSRNARRAVKAFFESMYINILIVEAEANAKNRFPESD